jgi:hypothetical protein
MVAIIEQIQRDAIDEQVRVSLHDCDRDGRMGTADFRWS